ncbi:MAG: hypothetical protein WA970_12985 [Gammaproteobacteria bacterium]
MRKVTMALALIGSVLLLPGYVAADTPTPADFERGNHQGWVRG